MGPLDMLGAFSWGDFASGAAGMLKGTGDVLKAGENISSAPSAAVDLAKQAVLQKQLEAQAKQAAARQQTIMMVVGGVLVVAFGGLLFALGRRK